MNTTAAKFVKRSRTALTLVNLLLVLALSRQLHSVLLHQTGHTSVGYTIPSILIVMLASLGMTFVIGLSWLRSSGLALFVQGLLLAAGCGLLLALLTFPL